jgi:hypothetical protein
MLASEPIKKTVGTARPCTANHRKVIMGYVRRIESVLMQGVGLLALQSHTFNAAPIEATSPPPESDQLTAHRGTI